MAKFLKKAVLFKFAAMLAAFSTAAILQPVSIAKAAIVETDWLNAGDGLVTRDLANGREWLDLTQSTGLTVAQAISQTGAGERLEGWRYANMDELFAFYGSAVGPVVPSFNGNTPIFDFTPSELASLTNFVDLLGVTFQLPFRHDTIGLIGHSAAQASEPNQAAGLFFYQLNGSGGFSWFNEGYTSPSYSDSSTGVFLIRNFGGAAVPEPASWMLMIAGFGLAGASIRGRRPTSAKATAL
jgi:PEP-CTERM motif